MSFTFNSAIPAAANNPSNDQPDMLQNNISTQGILAVDHFTFNAANGGRHQQVQLPLRGGSPGTIPPSLIVQEGTLYTKTAPSSGGNTETNLFYTPDLSANEYQLTRPITISFALFGTNTNNYNAVGVDFNGGWTFLPGGLLLQYGTATAITGVTVTFPVKFTNFCASVVCTILVNNPNRHFIQVQTMSNSGFVVASRDSSGNDQSNTFSWVAIGK